MKKYNLFIVLSLCSAFALRADDGLQSQFSPVQALMAPDAKTDDAQSAADAKPEQKPDSQSVAATVKKDLMNDAKPAKSTGPGKGTRLYYFVTEVIYHVPGTFGGAVL